MCWSNKLRSHLKSWDFFLASSQTWMTTLLRPLNKAGGLVLSPIFDKLIDGFCVCFGYLSVKNAN
jgi:hypothetical protein